MKSTAYADPAPGEDPFASPAPGVVPGAGLVLGATPKQPKKPTRAERTAKNKVLRLQAEVKEIALCDVPEAFRVELKERSAHGATGGLQVVGESRAERLRQIGSQRGTGVLPRGRPSEYTEDEADAICTWVAEGASLRSYCRTHGRAMMTVYRWMREATGFQARYAQAHEDRADTLTDEMLEIADESGVNATIEDVAAAKLRVETRKWIASKLRPQKWGDKQIIEHKGAVSIRIGLTAVKPTLPMAEVVDVEAKSLIHKAIPDSP